MKTGRVRQKEPLKPEESAAPTEPPPSSPLPPNGTPGKTPRQGFPIVGILIGAFACLALVVLLFAVLGGGKAKEWVQATQASGAWTTTVTVFGPQVTVEEHWEADCTANPNAQVRAGTCTLKDTTTYQDTVADEYDEYAYNIYYEETYSQIYEAQGTEFVQTTLKTDEWWKENLHYSLQEELDKESCQITNYTIWVDDPQDNTQEMEVYLSECEVWDHVTVTQRVYDQKAWCQCDVTSLVQLGQQSDQGTGSSIRWPNPTVPSGGRTETSFKGQVTFVGDDYTYTTTTEDVGQYQGYLTDRYYIGIRDGKPVSVSQNPTQ
jgi:hypothetical protein